MSHRIVLDSRRTAGALAVTVAVVLGVTACDSPPASPPAAAPSNVVATSAAPPAPSPSRVSPSAPPAPAADCVGRALGRMPLPELAGQVLMVGTSVKAPRAIGNSVAAYHLGGVFLHGRTTRSAAGLRRDIAAVQKRAGIPLLISLDQEGGSVQTLKGGDFPRVPAAQRFGAGPLGELRASTRDTARRLAAIGVTMNLAPVADTVPAALGESNPPIGAFHRQYGAEPPRVSAAIRTMVPASQNAGVLTVLKHFPGLGRVRANTDTSTRAVDATMTANDPHLGPFVAGIRAGSAAVMMSSASYPGLDRKAVAAFSRPIVTGLLRERLGYRGLIMSDDLGAGVAVAEVSTGQRAVRFVAAGGDLVLTIRPADAARMSAALAERAAGDPAFRTRLTEAARHVLQTKSRAGLLRC